MRCCKYLSSGAVKGIGPAMAAKIVAAFGENTLKVLEQEPERLTVIKGITKAKALKLSEEFRQSHGVRDAMEVLCGYGLTPEEALRVWRVIGPSCVELIRENPYSICEEEAGVSFEKADAIAAALERPQDDAWRVRAGVRIRAAPQSEQRPHLHPGGQACCCGRAYARRAARAGTGGCGGAGGGRHIGVAVSWAAVIFSFCRACSRRKYMPPVGF